MDLIKALDKHRKNANEESDVILTRFKRLLIEDDAEDDLVLQNIFGKNHGVELLNRANLHPEHIYHLDSIKAICTDYRLRFLDAEHFRGEIPFEAIRKIRALQRNQSREIKNYKILAPAAMFKLQEKDRDPLLFIPLSETHFLLVHKWGKDLSPFRRILVFPFRNFESLLLSLALLAFLVVMLVPNSVIMGPYDETSIGLRVIFFIYLFIAFSGMSLLYGFSRVKNFNANLWNSKYTS